MKYWIRTTNRCVVVKTWIVTADSKQEAEKNLLRDKWKRHINYCFKDIEPLTIDFIEEDVMIDYISKDAR